MSKNITFVSKYCRENKKGNTGWRSGWGQQMVFIFCLSSWAVLATLIAAYWAANAFPSSKEQTGGFPFNSEAKMGSKR